MVHDLCLNTYKLLQSWVGKFWVLKEFFRVRNKSRERSVGRGSFVEEKSAEGWLDERKEKSAEGWLVERKSYRRINLFLNDCNKLS